MFTAVSHNTQRHIDWDKVQTLEDVKRIIAAVEFSFSDNHPHIEKLEHLLFPRGESHDDA